MRLLTRSRIIALLPQQEHVVLFDAVRLRHSSFKLAVNFGAQKNGTHVKRVLQSSQLSAIVEDELVIDRDARLSGRQSVSVTSEYGRTVPTTHIRLEQRHQILQLHVKSHIDRERRPVFRCDCEKDHAG